MTKKLNYRLNGGKALERASSDRETIFPEFVENFSLATNHEAAEIVREADKAERAERRERTTDYHKELHENSRIVRLFRSF